MLKKDLDKKNKEIKELQNKIKTDIELITKYETEIKSITTVVQTLKETNTSNEKMSRQSKNTLQQLKDQNERINKEIQIKTTKITSITNELKIELEWRQQA